MPIYSDAKRRQMARSILPSKSGSRAREVRALIHRSHRRAVKQRLVDLRRFSLSDTAPDLDLDLGCLSRYPQREVRDMVWERRAADKLNHLETWAVRTTRTIPIAERLSYLTSVLPDGLVGEHAVSHLRWIEAIVPRAEHERRHYTQPSPDPVPPLVARLRELLAAGEHAYLNRSIRQASPCTYNDTMTPVLARTVTGLHDVEEFARYVARQAGGKVHADAVHRVLKESSL